ncbi:inositol monophosphatase family protein [Saccharospirillum mangrovi]|uniref:inositol monophosphatase family protein n=1 Tax=Saccharospirillum mangrovi TaxID=2161747 RepID=UPI000D3BB73C|nr:inositol monophosphatase family protein [Saccharospirillum mangrovi]
MSLSARLSFTEDLAVQAGQLIRKRREAGDLSTDFKGGIELVTDADLASEQLITSAIAASYPNDAILAEESNRALSQAEMNGPLWVIDPIDGTVNFAHGHNMVGVSIAWYDGGEAQVAVVYNPFLKECFTAIRGKGAWLNGQPIQVSGKTELSRAVVGTGFPYDRNARAELLPRLARVLEHCSDVRRLGSAAMDICWVACGRLDAYYETVSPWDGAAGQLVAREAGAQLSHFLPISGELPDELDGHHWLISTPAIHSALKSLLAES